MNKILKTPVIKILIISFIIRMIISLLPAFEIDQNDWRYWSQRLVQVGPSQFYSDQIFTDYTPGYLYVFWVAGEIKVWLFPNIPYTSTFFDSMLKFPANLADILSGILIYLIVKKKLGERWAIAGFLLYILNPAIFFNSSVWGQFDGSSTFFLLLALYIFMYKKIPELAAASFAMALTIKPQAIVFAPVFGIIMLLKTKYIRLISSFLIFLSTSVISYVPFFPNNPIEGILKTNQKVLGTFNCTTCLAYNFWGIFGNWKNDLNLFLNIPLYVWGVVLLLIAFILILIYKPFTKKYQEPYLYLTISVSILAFFTLLTRMHERYLFAFFPFFLIAALVLKLRKLIIVYILISALSFINLYYAYAYYNYVYTNKLNFFHPPFIEQIIKNSNIFSGLEFILFIYLLINFVKMMRRQM